MDNLENLKVREKQVRISALEAELEYNRLSIKQIKAIEYIKKVGSDAASKSNVFSGQVVIEEKSKKLCAVMVEKIIPNMMETLIKKHNPDLFVFINTQNENVSIRQCNQDNPINCAEFAEKFCNGGGKFNSSAGKITPLFMEITKNLKPV